MMRLTILICVLVAALLGSAWGGYALRGREVDKLKQAHAEQFAKAQADAARAAGRIIKTIQEAQDAEHIRRIDAEAAARRAAAATVGLRDELAATRAAVEALDWQLASSRKTAAATVAPPGVRRRGGICAPATPAPTQEPATLHGVTEPLLLRADAPEPTCTSPLMPSDAPDTTATRSRAPTREAHALTASTIAAHLSACSCARAHSLTAFA